MVTTTTLPRTTTTIDRFAEIEAIITDLEERRLDALYREDESAFRQLFASEELYRREAQAIGMLDWEVVPTVDVTVREVLLDSPDCLVAAVRLDYSETLGSEAIQDGILTFEPTTFGFGYSFRDSAEGWLCEGPHPLATTP